MHKNRKGYTVVTTIMTFAFLVILAMSLLMVTSVGVKMRAADSQRQFSFYEAESGLDEVYAEIVKYVDNSYTEAVEDALNSINDRIKDDLDAFDRHISLLAKGETPRWTEKDFIEENGVLKNEAVQNATREEFIIKFADLFNGKIDGDWETMPDSLAEPTPDIAVKILKNWIPFAINPNPGDTSKLTFQSAYLQQDGFLRKVEVTYNINIPDYQYAGSEEITISKMSPHILLTKALSTEQDIIFMGNNIEINGDIYAKGREQPADYIDYKSKGHNITSFPGYYQFGGITAGDNGSPAKVVINGDVVTGENVQVFASNSELQINGNIYCSNMVVQDYQRKIADTNPPFSEYKNKNSENWNHGELVNSKITVGGASDYEVTTKNKLVLMGIEKSHIEINGDYIGLSDSPTSEESFYDSTSSILINSTDITGAGDNKSTLTITKDAYVPGLGFVDSYGYSGGGISESDIFRLGESIAIKGNYVAYGFPLDPSEYAGFGYTDVDFKEFGAYTDYGFEPHFIAVDDSIDKAQYFENVYRASPNSIITGNDNINIRNIKYSLGAYVNGGTAGYDESAGMIDWGKKVISSGGQREKYNNNIANFGEIDKFWYYDFWNYREAWDGKIFGSDALMKKISETRSSAYAVNANNSQKFALSGSADVYVLGTRSHPNQSYIPKVGDIRINVTEEPTECVIITEGNVYLVGDNINYRGTIIAGGNIIIDGDNVTISNALIDSEIFSKDDYLNAINNSTTITDGITSLRPNILLTAIKQNDLEKYFNFYRSTEYEFVEYKSYDAGLDNTLRPNLDMKNIIYLTDWSRSS